MRVKLFGGLVGLGLSLACAGLDTPASGPPQGTWSMGESCGETAGGTGVFSDYTLHISGEEATLDADGYQLMLRTRAAVEGSADGIWTLRFTGHSEEDVSGAYLQPGDAMLTFTVEDGDLMVTPAELIFSCTEVGLFTRG
ncbi:MAG: hypothetical protein ACI8S6_000911 [Myxococcota bacterium]|jgi:hypothetical protein